MKANVFNSEHYYWGSHNEGWHFLKSDDLSVIKEKMLPHTSETKHFHEKAQQFFYILSGIAKFEINGETIAVNEGEGLHVNPRVEHRIFNDSKTDLLFLVISQPTSRGDRHNIQ